MSQRVEKSEIRSSVIAPDTASSFSLARWHDVLVVATVSIIMLLSVLLHPKSPHFFVQAFALFALAGTVGAVASRGPTVKNISLILASLAACLSVTELVLVQLRADRSLVGVTVDIDGQFKKYDGDLGYALIPTSRTHVAARTKNAVAYEATYNIDENGMRLTNPHVAPPASESVLFVGDSIIFGQALDDANTLPSQFARLQGSQSLVLNAGVPGYGPHNVLRAIEIGRYDSVMKPPPHTVVFLTFASHVQRASGLSPWENGPHYEVGSDGKLFFKGPYRSVALARARSFLYQSQVFQLIFDSYINFQQKFSDRGGEAALERYGAIVEQIKNLVNERYDARFIVLFSNFDKEANQSANVIAELKRRNIEIVQVVDLIPDLQEDPDKYRVPIDHHPNAEYHRLLAEYLHRRLRVGNSISTSSSASSNYSGN
jgi:hypothetical protein